MEMNLCTVGVNNAKIDLHSLIIETLLAISLVISCEANGFHHENESPSSIYPFYDEIKKGIELFQNAQFGNPRRQQVCDERRSGYDLRSFFL